MIGNCKDDGPLIDCLLVELDASDTDEEPGTLETLEEDILLRGFCKEFKEGIIENGI